MTKATVKEAAKKHWGMGVIVTVVVVSQGITAVRTAQESSVGFAREQLGIDQIVAAVNVAAERAVGNAKRIEETVVPEIASQRSDIRDHGTRITHLEKSQADSRVELAEMRREMNQGFQNILNHIQNN